jgi:hypothetical protein
MKAYWGVEVELQAFLTLELDGGEWSASPPGCYTWCPLDRRLGGPQSWTGHSEGKNSQPLPGLKPLIIQPIAHCYTTELSQLLDFT